MLALLHILPSRLARFQLRHSFLKIGGYHIFQPRFFALNLQNNDRIAPPGLAAFVLLLPVMRCLRIGLKTLAVLTVRLELARMLPDVWGQLSDFTDKEGAKDALTASRPARVWPGQLTLDYVAGTSTGAIVAAGLAIGMSTAALLEFYSEFGRQMFEKTFLLERLKSFYKQEPLAVKLQGIFHDGKGQPATLESAPLKCLLLVVTHNVTTDSAWPISTNPKAKYNAPDRQDNNRKIPLWQLVRASTAAPISFPPETLNWDPDDPGKSFVFQDGGITPYNNPAFLLFRMATQPAYRLEWKTGEENLLLVSVGTGMAPNVGGSDGKNRSRCFLALLCESRKRS